MHEENSKIYFACQAQDKASSSKMRQQNQLTKERHLKMLRNGQLIALDLIYGVDLKHRSKYELFLHLVNALNRQSLLPFLIKMTDERDMPISITYRYAYLLQQQRKQLNIPSQQDNTEQEGKNKKADFNQLWQWTDTLQKTILYMVHKSTIKESIYPRQYQLIEYLENGSSEVQIKFYSLVSQLIKQIVSQQNSEVFERDFTLAPNFPNTE